MGPGPEAEDDPKGAKGRHSEVMDWSSLMIMTLICMKTGETKPYRLARLAMETGQVGLGGATRESVIERLARLWKAEKRQCKMLPSKKLIDAKSYVKLWAEEVKRTPPEPSAEEQSRFLSPSDEKWFWKVCQAEERDLSQNLI